MIFSFLCVFAPLRQMLLIGFGTERGNRTPKVVKPVDFESTASTNSATSA